MNPAEEGKAGGTQKLDPLRRVFVPIERRTGAGQWTFETTDKDRYFRAEDGSIRRREPKVNGKLARKIRREMRRAK